MGFPHCGFFPGGCVGPHPLNFCVAPALCVVIWFMVLFGSRCFCVQCCILLLVCVWQLCTMKLNQCYMVVIEGKVLYGGMWEGALPSIHKYTQHYRLYTSTHNATVYTQVHTTLASIHQHTQHYHLYTSTHNTTIYTQAHTTHTSDWAQPKLGL